MSSPAPVHPDVRVYQCLIFLIVVAGWSFLVATEMRERGLPFGLLSHPLALFHYLRYRISNWSGDDWYY